MEPQRFFPDTRNMKPGPMMTVADPSFQAANCCGEKNQGVNIKENVHYCITCGKGFVGEIMQSASKVSAPHEITHEKMLSTIDELERQGLLDECATLVD
jgi:hypothetical protein